MSEAPQAPRGTRDLLPAQTRRWREVERVFHDVFRRYGYGELRTPLFEATELFVRGIGEGTDIVNKEMYTFDDRKGRSLTLRPEGTAGVVRSYVEHRLGQGDLGEAKLYYIGPMFRYERPQAGRYRQFWQAGVEAIGFADPVADAEVVAMLVTALRECGMADLSVDINSVGCPACRPAYLDSLRAHLLACKESLSLESQLRLETNPMRVMDSKDPKDKEAVDAAPKVTNHLCSACSAHFAQTLRHLERMGVPHQVNKKLVRGLDYYTRTAFEVLSGNLGAQNAVAGGGRYDGLIGQFLGKPRPAVGFGVGLDRLLSLLGEPSLEQALSAGAAAQADVAIAALGTPAQSQALALAQRLREAGLAVSLELAPGKSLKSQMRAASSSGARHTVILGEDELAQGVATVKHMDSGQQVSVPLAELLKHLQEAR